VFVVGLRGVKEEFALKLIFVFERAFGDKLYQLYFEPFGSVEVDGQFG